MQTLSETLYTVSAEFNVGIIGQKAKHPRLKRWVCGGEKVGFNGKRGSLPHQKFPTILRAKKI